MRAVILTDADIAARERAMLSRLEVGLADEGVRLVHAIPSRAAAWAHAEVFSQQLLYEDRGLSISRSYRARRLADSIRARAEQGERPADLLHVFGLDAWPLAAEIARDLECAILVEAWTRSAAAAAPAIERSHSGPAAWITPDAAIERCLRKAGAAWPIHIVPWGVHAQAQPAALAATATKTLSMLLVGSGAAPAQLEAALKGIAIVSPRLADYMLFPAAEPIAAANLWPAISKLGLASHVTLTPDIEPRREVALFSDVLIVPEALGEHRSIVLDAMGHGMLVIASVDADATLLKDAENAWLVDESTPERWAAVLMRLVESPDTARLVARAGWDFVRHHRKASAHVAGVLRVYSQLVSDRVLSFEPRS